MLKSNSWAWRRKNRLTRAQRLIVAVLSVSLLVTAVALAAAKALRAAGRGDFGEELAEATSKRIFLGYPGGDLEPDRECTRAEFCTMFVRALGKEQDAAIERRVPSSFIDVDVNYWGKGYLEVCRDMGLVQGDAGKRAFPERPITRAEAITICYRYLRSVGLTSGTVDEVGYSDLEETPEWATEAASRMLGLGIDMRDDVGRLRPLETMTRSEAVALILRIMELVGRRWDVFGRVIEVRQRGLQLTVSCQGETISLTLDPNVRVFASGSPVGLSAVGVGSRVGVVFESGSSAVGVIVIK